MRILLTGASGFIGSAFARGALRAGHEVAGLTRASALSSGALVLTGSLDQPPWESIRRFEPEVCVHTAWITTPGIYLESDENRRFYEQSLSFIEQLLRQGARRLFALGTCIEYAPNQALPLHEEQSALGPSSTYARLKCQLHEQLRNDRRLRLAWGRVFYPYGPGEHPNRLPSLIAAKLRRGERMLLRSPQALKDYIYIDDLAAAMLAVLENDFTGTINLGTGEGISILEMAQEIERQLGTPSMVEAADPPEPDPLGDLVANASRLRALGWRKQTALNDGLAALLRSFSVARQ